jgi:selenocysteine-specific elongation factor
MKHIVAGTAGHIDHGKSALVQALTGIDPDRLKEEKERGITIELGFAHATIGDVTVAFVDVPGHERFVKTMLAGVGGMDCVMLVVAADESVMPQTREHFDICRLLRVRHGIVVLTKADLVDAETLELVRMEVRELVEGSFLQDAPVLAVSARTGEGLDELRQGLVDIAVRVTHRGVSGAARLPIDRAFTMQGFGTVITGTLVGGSLRVDEELALVPGDRRVRIRGIQVHGRRREAALTGQRTAVNLGGVEMSDIRRGQTLTTPGSLTITRRLDAIVELLPSARPLKHGARVRFHQGTTEVLGRLSIAGTTAGAIEPAARAGVRIRLEAPAALTRGDRFILRAYSPTITVGGGEVLDPDPPRAGIRTASGARRFAALGENGERAIRQMIDDARDEGLAAAALVSRGGLAPGEAESFARSMEASGEVRRAADRLVAASVIRDASRRLLALVAEYHRTQPLADGIPREEARERILARAHAAVFDRVLHDLSAAQAIVVRDRLSLPGHRLELSPEEARARAVIEDEFKRAGMRPPDAAAIASERRIDPRLVEKMTALLLRQKLLTRIDTLVFHVETLTQLKAEIQALKTAAPGGRATVDVATFKDRYGVTRKFAIPLLEWLDRERVTRRMGDTRVVL